MQEAEDKFKEATSNLQYAKENLRNAKLQSEEIKRQGIVLANDVSQKLLSSIENDIQRLKNTNISILKYEEEKLVSEVVIYFTSVVNSEKIEFYSIITKSTINLLYN